MIFEYIRNVSSVLPSRAWRNSWSLCTFLQIGIAITSTLGLQLPPFLLCNNHLCLIYVDKAVPEVARKCGQGDDVDPGTALYKRLNDHAKSIDADTNLNFSDFRCRFLAVDDIWIPLAESMVIERFKPVWNCLLEGLEITLQVAVVAV